MSFIETVRAHYAVPEPPRVAPGTAAAPTSDTERWAAAALTAECEKVRTTTEGSRNDALNTAAFSLGQIVGGCGLDETIVVDALTHAGRTAGLEPGEIAATIRSGIAAGARTPRYAPERPPRPEITTWTPPIGPPATAPDPWDTTTDPATAPTGPEALWGARPDLDHIRTFARARRACPWAVLGVVLARIIVATPKTLVLPPFVGADASLNLFVGIVGPSGSGKGASEACAADAVHVGHIDAAGVGSGEGIAHLFMRRERNEAVQHRHAVLMRVAEIDTLAALGDRRGATLLPELRKAWSGEDLGFAYADPTKALPLPAHSYRLAMVAGIQPARAQWVLDDSDGGTPQRFLWMPAVDPDAPDEPPPCPDALIWRAPTFGALAKNRSTGNFYMTVCAEARNIIDANRLARLRGNGDALDGHALLARLKVAAALALLAQRLDITDDDWALSGHIAAISDWTRERVIDGLRREAAKKNQGKALAEAERTVVIDQHVDDAAIKRACQHVTRKLKGAPDGLTQGDLNRTMNSRLRGHLDAALDLLQTAGQITPGGGPEGTARWTLPKAL